MFPSLLAALLLLLPSAALAEASSLPPGKAPVEVRAGFYLVNLSGVSERSETFDADLYLNFVWQDSRLAFPGDEPRRFMEAAAVDQLEQMWWPQLEFVNTAEPMITNRTVEILPDGSVRYEIAMTSEFRTDLDLRRFPFDRQTLEVRIESFEWTEDQMVFVADPARIGFNPASTFEGLTVSAAGAEIRSSRLAGWGDTFSEFVVKLDVERDSAFYVWTILVPVILIFLISCTAFAVRIENFSDRIAISLTALLACIATQFAISYNLPQISYLTVIDRVFVVTYCCVALGVLVSTLEVTMLGGDHVRTARVDRVAGLGLPALFVALLALCMLW